MSFSGIQNFFGDLYSGIKSAGNAAITSKGDVSGSLGDFADMIDNSAQRTYIEDGFVNNIKPRNMEITMQQPDANILVKKRMFCSLINNHRLDLLNADERLFFKASKTLFKNKCDLISAYEKLSKINIIAENTGNINSYMFPLMFSAIDTFTNLGKELPFDSKTYDSINILRQLVRFSNPSATTTWLTDKDISFSSSLGEGTGVIEFTMFSNLNTSVGLSLGSGNASFSLEDPYKLMTVTNDDIDRAISDATNLFNINNFMEITKKELAKTIQNQTSQLNEARLNRRANNIIFNVEPNLISISEDPASITNNHNKKVRAFVDSEGIEIIFEYNSGLLGVGGGVGDINPKNILSTKNVPVTNPEYPSIPYEDSEESLFKSIVKNTYKLIKLEETTRSKIKKFNKQTNYVRQKMRLHFGNKPLIQPMDSVHIYLGSKTEKDNRVSSAVGPSSMGSLYNLAKMFQAVGDITDNIGDFFSSEKKTQNIITYLDIEKNAIVGPEFPMWLYKMFRNDFTREGAGVHVFAGIVDQANSTYSDGKYTLSVTISDNSGYFQNSLVNINPSLDVYNYNLYDPITPFDIKFDGVTGFPAGNQPDLLSENVTLLNSGQLRFPNGPSKGSVVDLLGIKYTEKEPARGGFRQVLHAPQGMVYRWKQGIGAMTKNGKEILQPGFASEFQPKLSQQPFAGQDSMNVLSLLITGQPYNYNTFIKAAINSGSLQADELTNQSYSSSYYRGLISELTKQNQIWGNFIPFKSLIYNADTYSWLASGENSFVQRNAQLTNLLKIRSELFDQLAGLNKNFAKNPRIVDITDQAGSSVKLTQTAVDTGFSKIAYKSEAEATILRKIASLDIKIDRIRKAFNSALESPDLFKNGQLKIFGNDFAFLDPSIVQSSSSNSDQQKDARDKLRKKLNSLTLRKSWRVRSNTDVNLFIVDESYDLNYDIQAFEQSFPTNAFSNLFQSSYTDVLNQIRTVTDICLGLEVYADTQGHIQARSPQYNRMPKSVFFRMIQNKEYNGVQIFPEYLENLFINQIDDITNQLFVIELEIRLRTAILGRIDDTSASSFLSQQNSKSFSFLTPDPSATNAVSPLIDLKKLIKERNLDDDKSLNQFVGKAEALNGQLKNAVSATNVFNIAAQIDAVNDTTTINPGYGDSTIQRIEKIRESLRNLTGQPAQTVRDLVSYDRLQSGTISQSDALKLIQDLSVLVSQRQRLIIVMNNSLTNLSEGLNLNKNANQNKAILAMTFPQLSDLNVPKILEHMIEDEDVHDLGPGSGSRYIINDNQIISLTINENKPEYTAVQVNGIFDPLIPDGPAGLNLEDGGNQCTSAQAVDYDLWNMYGFKKAPAVSAPFFTNPDTQCLPFAVYLLNQQRKKILKGSLTIIGNEYMQPGEVIYIEDRDLLFYVTSVSHSFSYSGNGNFTTELKLEYGHNPGEYIPTPLDVIGKSLYNNRFNANEYRTDRFDNANGDQYLGAIGIDALAVENTDGTIKSGEEITNALINSTCGDLNKKTLLRILYSCASIFDPNNLNKIPNLQLRYYYNKENGNEPNPEIASLADAVKSWFMNPTTRNILKGGLKTEPLKTTGISIDQKYIKIIPIDLSKKSGATASPSQEAFNLVKIIKGVESIYPSDEFPTEIYNNILDIVVSFENPTGVLEESKPSKSETDQFIADANAAIKKQILELLKGK